MDSLFQIYDAAVYFFSAPAVQKAILWGKIISGLLSAVFLYGIVVLMIKTNFIKKKKEKLREMISPAYKLPKGKIGRQWEKINGRLESANEADHKMALIEADKLFDDILARIGYKGETMADRLKQLDASKFANIQNIWNAHKTRNALVHDPYFHLSQDGARNAIAVYESALKELEALE